MTTLFISHSSKDKAWAADVRGALRGQGYESLFLDSHPDDGIPAGARWEQVLWQRLRQSRGLVALCTANWLRSPWCVAEAMMARERGKPVFLLAAEEVGDGRQVKSAGDGEPALGIPDFLRDTQFISLAGLTAEGAFARLWRGLEAKGLKDAFPLPDRPYPGLEPFQEKDAAVFFGRGDEITRVSGLLNRRLKNHAKGFILVLGASGCGKSSLVRAGVLPRLRPTPTSADAPREWIIAAPVLGRDGLDGLRRSLASAFDGRTRSEARQSRLLSEIEAAADSEGAMIEAEGALGRLANDLLVACGGPAGKLLLVLDQLEEVFATAPGSAARALLRLLLEATADDASPLVVLATMRSDFLNDFQLFPGAAERYESVTLDPMPRARFGEVIEGPAGRFGLTLDPGLTGRLVADSRYDDALPLLAFTLERLYAKGHADGRLTIEEYEDLFPPVKVRREDGGITEYRGVSAAIKHVADEVLDQAGYLCLPEDSPRVLDLRRAFHGLARIGEAGQFTRRLALWSRMPDSCADVLKRFVDQRLLVSGMTGDGEPTLSVAHEALFRVWDTLNAWLRKDRKALALRNQIEEAAGEWEESHRAESRQWPEERILDAVGEIRRSGVRLDDVGKPEIVGEFLGPTGPEDLVKLPALGADADATAGSGRYGGAWRLPLGHEARASLGVRLALLGDRRRGVGLRDDGLPDIDWVRVEGGEVTIEIRANRDDPDSEIVDALTRTVERPFWIGRYPATVAHFKAFLGECHREGSWRLPPGFPVGMPAHYPPPKHRGRHDNYPADTVNWWDALAFCHWLGARLGAEVRLPTELEWQLAATGGEPERIYPWGPEWDPQAEPWRANTYESGLNRATAVGLYPLGASPAGVLDMAGTVYEWCLNAFDDPDLMGLPRGREDRCVVRGGCWFYDQLYARSVYRHWFFRSSRHDFVGFRVVCSSSVCENRSTP